MADNANTSNLPVATTTTTPSEPEVDRSVHPSGIVPTLQCVLFIYIYLLRRAFSSREKRGILSSSRSARLNSIENWKKARFLLTLYFLSLLILMITKQKHRGYGELRLQIRFEDDRVSREKCRV